jgi:lipid A oxidase
MRLGNRWIMAIGVMTAAVHASPARADWTVAAYIGAAHTLDASLTVEQPARNTDLTFDPVSYRGQSFTGPLYYGFRVGHTLPLWRNVSIEGEYVHLKAYAETDRDVHVRGQHLGAAIDRTMRMRDIVERFSISHGVNLLTANVVFRFPLAASHRAVTLTGRFGVGPTLPHGESDIDGVTQEQYELGSFAVMAAAGAEFRLWRQLHGVTEYKFSRTRETVDVSGGRATSTLRSHHVVFGVGYSF